MDHEDRKSMSRQSKLYVLLGVVLVMGGIAYSCSVEPKKQVVTNPAPPSPPPPPPPSCDGTPAGTTREVACPTGKVGKDSQVCTADGKWIDVTNTCSDPPPPTCSKTTFDDVKPILQQYCTTCHAAITTYATAQAWSSEIVRRTKAPSGNNDHMPPTSQPQLCPLPDKANEPCPNRDLLQKWVSDGALQDCTQASNPTFIDLNYQDTAALNDAASLSPSDRPFIRYLYMGHAIDAGLDKTTLANWVQAANKALNSLNDASQNLHPLQSVEPAGAVWRIDLRDYAIGAAEIAVIDAGDVIANVVDKTSKGQALGALLGTQKPWYHLDNFIDVTFANSGVYYAVLNVPTTLVALQAAIGVNFQSDLSNLNNVNFIGFNTSPIAQHKNRLLVRDLETRDNNAAYWQTFDVNFTAHLVPVQVNGQTVQEDTKQLAQFPLLAGTGNTNAPPGATLIFTPDASEVIWTLPNGLHGYGLFDAAGNRLNAADTQIVIDTQSPVSQGGAIQVGNSCVRCHNAGFIPAQDQILAAVNHTGLPNSNDAQIVRTVYKAAGADGAFFKKDNAFYAAALAKIGVDAGKPDPMSIVTDRFRQNWDLTMASAWFFKPKDQFLADLQQSQVALGQIGGLANGQNVTFAQFFGVHQQLIIDAREFQDQLGN